MDQDDYIKQQKNPREDANFFSIAFFWMMLFGLFILAISRITVSLPIAQMAPNDAAQAGNTAGSQSGSMSPIADYAVAPSVSLVAPLQDQATPLAEPTDSSAELTSGQDLSRENEAMPSPKFAADLNSASANLAAQSVGTATDLAAASSNSDTRSVDTASGFAADQAASVANPAALSADFAADSSPPSADPAIPLKGFVKATQLEHTAPNQDEPADNLAKISQDYLKGPSISSASSDKHSTDFAVNPSLASSNPVKSVANPDNPKLNLATSSSNTPEQPNASAGNQVVTSDENEEATPEQCSTTDDEGTAESETGIVANEEDSAIAKRGPIVKEKESVRAGAGLITAKEGPGAREEGLPAAAEGPSVLERAPIKLSAPEEGPAAAAYNPAPTAYNPFEVKAAPSASASNTAALSEDPALPVTSPQ